MHSSRRQFLTRVSLAAGGAVLLPSVLAACGSDSDASVPMATANGIESLSNSPDPDWGGMCLRKSMLDSGGNAPLGRGRR